MEAAHLASSGDPLTVTRQVGDFFGVLLGELERVADVRLRALSTLRDEGWSYDRIARASGLSKARVAQLVRDAGAALPCGPDLVRPRPPGSPGSSASPGNP